MLIIFDNGHGIETPGKMSPDKSYYEWKFTREFVDILCAKAKALKLDYIDLDGSGTKDTPLATRVAKANELWRAHNKQAIFISIHSNAVGNGGWMNAKGWSIFVGTKASANSKRLANCIFDSVKSSGVATRQPSATQKYWVQSLYVCNKTSMPAVLIENMFHDNKEDLALLKSTEFKNKLADSILAGIRTYLK